ncbi:MAG: glycosyltransferase [Candidatus Doudnabacteria bacterium]|nr:glycosyltransferase [Candidatus Doudnabacteria bacterium]
MKLPVVTIVIPTLNESAHIENLLHDLRGQTLTPAEVIVVDGYSPDGTAEIARAYKAGVRVLQHGPHVAKQRNMGGYSACGDVIVFLDADTRLHSRFLERAVGEFERRHLDVACPWYVPHQSTLLIHGIYVVFNAMFYILQKVLASGAGSCIIVRRSVLHESRGFDPAVTFDDIDLIRHLSWKGRFGVLHTTVGVSDRRFRTYGVVRMTAVYLILSMFFAVGAFRSANLVSYEFGKYKKE